MNSLQKWGGIAASGTALIYMTMFIIFGAVLSTPANLNVPQKVQLLQEQYAYLYFSNLLGYVFFGLVLAVLTLTVFEKLKSDQPHLSALAAYFGVIWVGILIASGMIGNITLHKVVQLAQSDALAAWEMWRNNQAVIEGLGGGNEIVGGLWVLFISIAALRSKQFTPGLNYLGLLVAAFGISTIYRSDTLTALFGLSQIIWFFYLSYVLLKNKSS